MAHEFNADEKEVKEFSERIGFGVHSVLLVSAEAGSDKADKDYIDVTVVSEDGIEETVRMWFTGGASNISFNTLRQILVHSVDTEEKKAAVRDGVDAVKNTDELTAMLNKAAGSGHAELWMTKYYDATRTYTNAQGQTRRSINTNIYGYQPKLKSELMPKEDAAKSNDPLAGTPLAGGEEVPFESAGDAPGSTVPKKDAWAK